jgi:beta-N-acetylhexosaminidase
MFFRYNLNTSKEEVRKLLSEAAALVAAKSGIAPFMAVDHEGGLVHRFGPGIEKLPPAFSFWELAQEQGRAAALARAETLYSRSAAEIRELGITLVLAPVAEILDDENRIFLDTRSYGPDPDFTQAAASAFIRSMDSAGIASALKHFPGNTAADPHSGASTLRAGKAALDEMVKPFAAIIRGLSPPVLMLSHVMVPAVDSRRNASLSRPVIEGWLRGELGFQGIALADDYSMAAVAATGLGPSAAAVEALNAGIDMIMTWPRDITAVHTAILDALKSGRLPRERLLEAAGRVIAEKIRYDLVAP